MKKSIQLFANLLFWIANIVIFGYTTSIITTQLNDRRQITFFVAANLLIPLYWILRSLLRIKSLNKRQQFIYPVLFLAVSFLIVFLLIGRSFLAGLSAVSLIIIWNYIISLFLYGLHSYTQKKLHQQNLQSELALLRSQINPHFLFNSLHNIDALIKTEPETASHLLLKLSEIMRYMLYDANSDKVPLQKEIDHLENFLTLQNYRFKNKGIVTYKRTGDPENIEIGPMLLIPFIENAFKHYKSTGGEDKIEIALSINNHIVNLICSNRYNPGDLNKDSISGIGLDIVKRRLELMYHKRYTLEINDKNNIFDIRLSIDTHDH
jgi:sensor histidine kinase YesM